MNSKPIGFIGAGKMAQALAGGIAKTHPETSFVIAEPNPLAEAAFRDRISRISHSAPEIQTTCVPTSQMVFQHCELVFLATKPQMAASALAHLAIPDPANNLVVSIMAGITIDRIRDLCGQQRIIRVMPNTPCLIGKGASAIASSASVSETENATVTRLFESLGIVVRVEESLLDAVTGLSGSGPAYVFSFIEALIQGGVAAGLPEAIADPLARQTVLGAVSMLNELTASPAELRNQVTSPGGTTLAGLRILEHFEFDQSIIRAVLSATARSRELGNV